MTNGTIGTCIEMIVGALFNRLMERFPETNGYEVDTNDNKATLGGEEKEDRNRQHG